MAVTVRLPGSLRDAVGGTTKLEASGRTVGEVIADLEARYPGFRSQVLDDQGRIRTYVQVFIGDQDARDIGGTSAPVPEGAEVMLIPAMAGGLQITAARLRLTRAQFEQLRAHALRGVRAGIAHGHGAYEVCGLLAGRDGVVSRVIECENTSPTPVTNYRVAERDLLHVPRIEDAGEELVAIYHSHPVTAPYPSETDVREVRYPESLYVLLSLRRGFDEPPEINAFAIEGGGVRDVPVEIAS